ncbi:MAG: prepilin-type N-terminal cleavage/methylation domain-containing protein [Bacilli bacterium]|nr:prepilin-type N-terminal cleavage/methylation domain-containing protein [Bacilli bacterium]
MKNNKGFTIAELLVTFVLVMSIVLALFKVVDHYRERQQNATSVKEMNSYRNQIVKVVEDDILFNCEGIKEIKGLDLKPSEGPNSQQGIKITFNGVDDNGVLIAKNLIVKNNGILYGDMFYEFPSKFVSAVDDVIYTETKVSSDDSSLDKAIYSIHIDLTHSELNRIFNINIVAVNNTPTDTTSETP